MVSATFSIGTSSEKSLLNTRSNATCSARTYHEPGTAREIGARRFPLEVQHHGSGRMQPDRVRRDCDRFHDDPQLTSVAQPSPAAPRHRVELLLVPALAEAHERARSSTRRTVRPRSWRRPSPSPSLRRRRARDRRAERTAATTNLRNAPGARVSSMRAKTAEGDRQAGPQRRIEASPANHQRAARRRRAANPAGDRTTGWIAPVSVGDTGGFRRQRPAFADVPLGPVHAVPIHLVRARSAEQHRIRNGPAKRQRRPMLDEVDARAQRIDDEPDRRQRRRRSSTSPPPSTRAAAATAASAATAGIASPIHAIGRRRSSDWRRSIARTGATRSSRATMPMASSRRNAGAATRE